MRHDFDEAMSRTKLVQVCDLAADVGLGPSDARVRRDDKPCRCGEGKREHVFRWGHHDDVEPLAGQSSLRDDLDSATVVAK